MSDERVTLTSVVKFGTMDELLSAVARLACIEEFGMNGLLAKASQHAAEAKRLESLAAAEREKARQVAGRIVSEAKRHWTCDEIETTTGYKP